MLVDTGAWYALIDRKDPDHERVRVCLDEHLGRMITTDYVVDETITLLRYRAGWKAARAFGKSLLDNEPHISALVTLKQEERQEAWKIFCRYRDKSFSFTDCTSFALMRKLKLDTAIAIDRDFRSFGLHCIPH
ncbi:MAG: type II toxin-antitoxin system VapC family toxin [Gammaproteobacteria bacterium]